MMQTSLPPSGYSSIFASGLLATPRPNRTLSPGERPTTPGGADHDTTPTALRSYFTDFSLGPVTPLAEFEAEPPLSRSRASSTSSNVPRLRRRRSSLTVGTGSLSSIKSPLRSAGNALQRTSLMSPTTPSRTRSGSTSTDVDMDEPPLTAPPTGRMRSGSLGYALRPRRTVRKPAAAPPTAPLPAPPMPIPALPTDGSYRRPLVDRSLVTDNYGSFSGAAEMLSAAKNAAMGGDSPIDGVFWDGMKEN
ncbi:hypothetical protein EVG20_g4093 [Dentipellis fragilis]|uniref:Uncharacterized protein n=1 Tax=Dentipellis fragilis TaxID=205917 RepID=A0A4Y9YZH3_9AGAM|nr:hypothetical protein EVG20_g4093 [Dentipellis fragilis]